jgi:glycosylphosphatidylinositol deacylase
MPSVDQSMRYYEKVLSRFLIPVSFLASFLPWPPEFYLGLGSSAIFAPLAPLILLLASGLVVVSWWALRLCLFLLRPISVILVAR